MVVALGSDHAGYRLKQYLVRTLADCGYTIVDCGTDSEESVDYPDFAMIVCRKIIAKEAECGIIVCGTGIGVSIAANKLPGIRAALCHTEFSARMARLHNDANVLTLGGRVFGEDLALSVARAFLDERFSGEERHRRRVDKIIDIEEGV